MVYDLLHELNRRGIRLRVVDDRLDVTAPAGTLDDDVRARLTAERDTLVALLRPAAPDPAPAARPDERYEPFPLTDIQHAYWVGRLPALPLGGVSTHYYLELEGTGLDPVRLGPALRRVIERHDMLRAVVRPDGRQQVLREVPPYDLTVHDLRGWAPDAREAELLRLRDTLGHQVLDPHRWPLFDVHLSRLTDDRLRLHLSVSMLVADAASLEVLFADWRQAYLTPARALAPVPYAYRDHVLATEAQRDGPAYRSAERYWLDRLDSLPPPPALPTRPTGPTTRFEGRADRLAEDRWATLKATGRRHGLTPSVVLLTAFTDVLRYWSRWPDLTLNLTLFDRPSGVAEVVGDFTSLVMLAVDGPPGGSFVDRATGIQRRLQRDLTHAAYGGVRVLRERARRTGAGPEAAMPVVFTSALGVAGGEGRRFFGEVVFSISQTPQVWLDHQVFEEAGELRYAWDAVSGVFPEGVLDDMFAAYRRVLDRLGDEALWTVELSIVELPGWQAAERTRANGTAHARPEQTLVGLVEARAAAQPDAPAVIATNGTLTYREVVETGHRLARRLRALGAGPGELVAVLLDKGFAQVPAVFGIVASGAAYLPIDPRWPAARRDRLLTRGRVRLVVAAESVGDLRVVTPDDPEVRAAAPTPLSDGPTPDDLAYVIFTSGSTGEPKGVMIDHRGAVNTILDINARFAVGPRDRVLGLSALTFDLSVYDVFGVLAAGGTLVLPGPGGVPEPTEWTDLVARHGVTIWNSVPALLRAWTESGGCGVGALRLVLLSGDWIPVDLPGAVWTAYPAAEVVSLGGATEASIWSVHHRITEVRPDWASIPYGTPLTNQTSHVYGDGFRPCPVWTVGELYLGGVGVARGYWDDPDRTAHRFVTHPVTGERLYRTGDLGRYRPGGEIEFLGREDQQVKLNGQRIELGEITAALRQCAGVAEAVVDVATHPDTGRGRLVAYVVPDRARWPALLAAGHAEVAEATGAHAADLATFSTWWRRIEEVVPLLLARTLAQTVSIKPEYGPLVRQWHAVLETSTVDGDIEAAFTVDDPLVDYLRACADRQVDLLRGSVSPLELLLPDGDTRVVDALYATNPMARVQNLVAARIVREAVSRARGPVRILEIGAGTGATTAAILPGLPAGRVSYRFTDVSRYFTDRARQRFAGYPFVEYGQYDIDQPPEPDSVDVIVAANVLHDARNLAWTLDQLRTLLAPGGLLVAIEGTANSRIQLISVGYLEGFGHSGRSQTLLSTDEWRDAFAGAGFARFAAVPEGAPVTDTMAQHVLVAEAPGGVGAETLRPALADLLPRSLVPAHYVLLDRLPLTPNGKLDRAALPPPWPVDAVVEAPRDGDQQRLLAIWRDVLQRDDFGVEDNFFELGGDSLHAVRLLGRVRDEFGLPLRGDEGLQALFDSPTVAELARVLRGGGP